MTLKLQVTVHPTPTAKTEKLFVNVYQDKHTQQLNLGAPAHSKEVADYRCTQEGYHSRCVGQLEIVLLPNGELKASSS